MNQLLIHSPNVSCWRQYLHILAFPPQLRNCPERRVRDSILNVPWNLSFLLQPSGERGLLSAHRELILPLQGLPQQVKLAWASAHTWQGQMFSPRKVWHRNKARQLASTKWGLCGRHFAFILQCSVGSRIGFPASQMRNIKLISMGSSSYHPNWSRCANSGIPLYSQTQKLIQYTEVLLTYLSMWKYSVKLSDSKVFPPDRVIW